MSKGICRTTICFAATRQSITAFFFSIVSVIAFLVTGNGLAQAQTYKVLYRFTGGAGGESPYGRLTLYEDSLYGTALGGGSGSGVVFTANKQTGVMSFSLSVPSGAYPLQGVVRSRTGSFLYGAAALGGQGYGEIFKLSANGAFTGLYTFQGGKSDGVQPQCGLILDKAGNLYGTTALGGSSNFGTVFEIEAGGSELVLHSFTGGNDGQFPHAGLTFDSAGNLYGTTAGDGTATFGTVFKVFPNGEESVLYKFSGGIDGSQPMANLSQDKAGNLYGTTRSGGAYGNGTVFKVNKRGNETVIYSFAGGTDGASPQSAVLVGADDNLYGTTVLGGNSNLGTIFGIESTGKETILHSFSGNTDGKYPYAGLVSDSVGNLYGTTTEGGSGYGTIFTLKP